MVRTNRGFAEVNERMHGKENSQADLVDPSRATLPLASGLYVIRRLFAFLFSLEFFQERS